MMQVNILVLLAGLVGAIPFVLIARQYRNRIPLALYAVLLLGTATVLGHPHSFHTGAVYHAFVALTGIAFLWFTYTGHKQVEHVRDVLRKQGVARVK